MTTWQAARPLLVLLLLAGCAPCFAPRPQPPAPAPALTDGARIPVAVGQPAGTIAAQASLPPLAPEDLEAILISARYALDSPRVNQATTWHNRTTQNSGALTPLWLERSPQGQECRDYIQLLKLQNLRLQALGTACRAADGRWLIAR